MTRSFAAPALVRTAAARVLEQTGTQATRPSAFAQLLDLAFPLSLYEQAPFVGHDVAAIALTSAGDRPPPAVGDTMQRLNANRLAGIGRSSQALLGSLDGEVELAEGTSAYLYLGARTIRGWAIVLILFTALLPCLAVIVDLFARLRRRHIPLAPALRSYRSRLLFWLFAALLFEAFIYLGRLADGRRAAAGDGALAGNGLARRRTGRFHVHSPRRLVHRARPAASEASARATGRNWPDRSLRSSSWRCSHS